MDTGSRDRIAVLANLRDQRNIVTAVNCSHGQGQAMGDEVPVLGDQEK